MVTRSIFGPYDSEAEALGTSGRIRLTADERLFIVLVDEYLIWRPRYTWSDETGWTLFKSKNAAT